MAAADQAARDLAELKEVEQTVAELNTLLAAEEAELRKPSVSEATPRGGALFQYWSDTPSPDPTLRQFDPLLVEPLGVARLGEIALEGRDVHELGPLAADADELPTFANLKRRQLNDDKAAVLAKRAAKAAAAAEAACRGAEFAGPDTHSRDELLACLADEISAAGRPILPEDLEVALRDIYPEHHVEYLQRTLRMDIEFPDAPDGASAAREAAMPPLQTVLTQRFGESGVRETRTPQLRMVPIVDTTPPLDFDGNGRQVGTVDEIFEDPADVLEFMFGALRDIGDHCDGSWRHPGMPKRRWPGDHRTFGPSRLNPQFRGVPLCLRDRDAVRKRVIDDRPCGEIGIDWMESELERFLPGGLAAYPDCNTLHQLRYGFRYRGQFADTVTLVAPLASAMPNLAEIAAEFTEEMEAAGAKYQAFHHPIAWPWRSHAVGMVLKKGKARVITDAGSPHNAVDDGLTIALNAASEEAGQPLGAEDTRWVQTAWFLEAAEITAAIHAVLAQEGPYQLTAEELVALKPVGWSTDRKAFYRQFPACVRDQHMQGVLVPLYGPDAPGRREDSALGARRGMQLLDTGYVVFGPKDAPEWATDVGHLQTTLRRFGNWEWEDQVRADAENGCPVCARLWPEKLRLLMASRERCLRKASGRPESAEEGENPLARRQTDLNPNEQYIDDCMALGLGVVRGLHSMWLDWQQAEEKCANLPVSWDKGQFGGVIVHLGIKWFVESGTVATTPERKAKLNETLDRMRRITTVEHAELESLIGTLGFVGQITDGMRTVVGRSHRALSNKRLWAFNRRSQADAMAARRWLQIDLEHAQRLLNDHTVSACMRIPWSFDLAESWQALSDANRCLSTRSHSGLGGFVTFPTYVKFWHLKLPPHLVDEFTGIPVHVTERLCANITLAVMPELKHGALIQMIDNQPAVCALSRKTSRDLRMQELNLLTEHQLEARSLRTETVWISTEQNEWADLLSRGRIAEFRALATAAGAQELIEIELFADGGPLSQATDWDLPQLLDRLQRMSILMRAQAKEKAEEHLNRF